MKRIFLNIFILFILKSNVVRNCADSEKSPFEKILSQRSFIDKTDLIKAIMEKYKNLGSKMVLTMPRQFGKTTNMDMIKRFLECSQDEVKNTSNFLLFRNRPHNRPLNIMNDQNFVKEHFGKYPVIHIDLSMLMSRESLDTLFTEVTRKFAEAIKEYEWLYYKKYQNATELEVDDLEMKECFELFLFTDASNIRINNRYYTFWLLELGRSLKKYYGVAPILLVDEYDCPILEALLHRINTHPIIQKLEALWLKTLKVSDSPFLFTFMVGTLGINPDTRWILIFTQMSFLSNYQLVKFYGFHKDEMNLLFQRYNISDEDVKSHILRYYNGYRSENGEQFHNPGSVCDFLTEVSYLSNPNYVKEVAQLFRSHRATYLIDLLQPGLWNPFIYDKYVDLTIYNKSINIIDKFYQFYSYDVKTILFQFLWLKCERLYFSLLLRTGFLSCDEGIHSYRIPNEEVRYHLVRSFSNYYYEKNYDSCCLAKTVIKDFNKIANNIEVSVEDMNKTKNSLQSLFKYDIMKKKEINAALTFKKNNFRTSLYVALHQSGNCYYVNTENIRENKDNVENKGKNKDTFGEADIVLVTEDCNTVLIVEFEYNVRPQAFNDAIKKQLKRYVPTVPFRNMIQGFNVTLKYLLVNVIIKSEKDRKSKIKEPCMVEMAYCPAGNYSKEDISTISPLVIKFDKSCIVLRKNKPRIKRKLK